VREDRRARILEVAAGLFAEQGYHGVSIDALGAAVGMSGPGLYRYFAGKEWILAAMLTDISDSLLAGGRHLRESHGDDPPRLMRELLCFQVRFALDHPDLIAVQARDLGNVPASERTRIRRTQSEYVALWTESVCAATGTADVDRARSAVNAVFGLIHSTPHSARLARPEMEALLLSMAQGAINSL
jgi:AcrR family transcriptional regulator